MGLRSLLADFAGSDTPAGSRPAEAQMPSLRKSQLAILVGVTLSQA